MLFSTLNPTLLLTAMILSGLFCGLLVIFYYQRQLLHRESEIKLKGQHILQLQQENDSCLRTISSLEQQNIHYQLEQKEQQVRLVAMQEQLKQQIAVRQEWREEYEKLNQELHCLRDVNREQEAELREATTRLEETVRSYEDKQRILVNSEQRLQMQFENLANRIFENSGQKVDEQNRQSLDALLTPLREQLDIFRRQVQENFSQEARERHTLSYEIKELQKLNNQMTQEAINLTNALKGNNKTQGNWGEMVLNQVLESSGLREGHEYHIQVNLLNENRERQQPDVIIHLPQEKSVIIDAKMSLLAYERYYNSDDENERAQALIEHVQSVKQHIRKLGEKHYQSLPQIKTLDYVLLFIPIESAFMLAINQDRELISEAAKYNIMLVSPTTLLIALRTINNMWRYEYQNQNAKVIADKAARLYDKMRLFVDDMLQLGQSLTKAEQNYQQAINKLSQGRGNMLGQIEYFRTLGVEVKRPISNELLKNQADDACNLNEDQNVNDKCVIN